MPVIIGARITNSRPLAPNARELHHLACELFEARDDEAGHTAQDKPFTIWPPQQPPGGPSRSWMLRTAWLRPDSPAESTSALDKIDVGRISCAVTEIMVRTATHAQLAAGPALGEARLTFVSPTYFAHNGGTLLTPDPRRISESWRRSWNTWLPKSGFGELRIDDETWAEINKTVELAEYHLRTTTMATGHSRDQSGFTGSATLRLSRMASAPARSAFSTLARFAEFCGTGAQTTQGFGATRLASHEW
jgi:CRISPR-associated endoribonuclease Cas6